MAKKKAKAKGKQEIEKSTAGLPTKFNFEDDAGQGLEGADQDSFALPFMVVLQKGSPQCDEDSPSYIKGAKSGMLFNTATGEYFAGPQPVVPVSFQRKIVEWIPRDDGGGFVASHNPETINFAELERDESGRWINAAGNHLIDTRYHFLLHLREEDGMTVPDPVVFPLTSTQIKKSRNWVTKMDRIRMKNKQGKQFKPATFATIWAIDTIGESNDKGSWKGVLIEPIRTLSDDEAHIYQAAKEFKALLASGDLRVVETKLDPDEEVLTDEAF